MARVCFILVAGLDQALLNRAGALPTLGAFTGRRVIEPVTPAVTSTMQATLTTGATPGEHGIIANGLYTHGRSELHANLDLENNAEFRRDVSFWEQSNRLLQWPRFWQRGAGRKPRTAMLFWQNSMGGAADVVLTPKPTHTPEGKTLSACWSDPADLYARLTATLGPFPLMKYWGPFAGIESSRWIVQAAIDVWETTGVELEFVYVPHLDYNLQRLGPGHAGMMQDMEAVDRELAPLVAAVRSGGGVPIVAGDYGMFDVRRVVWPNRALREAGLLATRADGSGKAVVDYANTPAFAMVDHQIAHVYCRPGREAEVVRTLEGLDGVGRVLATPAEIAAAGLASERSGSMVLLAAEDAWFVHDWWANDAEKPMWQFTVDIHAKPGYDPRELFVDPARKCIAQDPGLVKGSHGLATGERARWPVLLGDAGVVPEGETVSATAVGGWLARMF